MCTEYVGRVLQVDRGRGEATVDTGVACRVISLAILSVEGVELSQGDWVRIHTGLALERMSERDALGIAEQLSVLDEKERP